ncbi:hypothetical protein CQW23_09176 [Capsicum baccatum]|uniref:Serine aminopeptidase S33 domain-containing protein n=1 Tax=Capsicum baccatum TaxID=33114 RepID=A0A2G2WW81_CAPBA|nr:hypothetical protein CQW23_09176 [Capsicum baccatum]
MCTFYTGIAKHIVAAGYAVYAIDHPGFGLSDGLHGFILNLMYIDLTFKMAKSGCISLSAIIRITSLFRKSAYVLHLDDVLCIPSPLFPQLSHALAMTYIDGDDEDLIALFFGKLALHIYDCHLSLSHISAAFLVWGSWLSFPSISILANYINHGPPVLMLYNHVKTIRITAERVETIEVWAALFGAEIINDKTKKSHVLATASVGSAVASLSSSLSPCCLRFVSSFVDNNNNIGPRIKLTFVSCFLLDHYPVNFAKLSTSAE